MIGISLLLVGAPALVASASFNAPARARVIGGNAPVNAGAADLRDISAHNSSSLVRNPLDQGNIVVANRVDTPFYSCALHVSFDGGAGWSQTAIPVPEGEEPKCYAPEAAFASDGILYLSFVTLQGLGNVPNGVWVATSRDGGRTLSSPTRAVGPLAFQVRLVADSKMPGRLYLTWVQAADTAVLAFPNTGYPVNFARSDDGGATWSDPVRVSSASRERVVAPTLAVSTDGELYVLYLDVGDDKLDYNGGHEGRGGEPYPGNWSLVQARSSDNGAAWTETVVEPRLVPTERFIVFLPPSPSLAIDQGSGRVYAAFTDGRRGDADVWLWVSEDRGESWTKPVRVNETASGDGTSQYRPKVAVAPGGRVDVIYYDRRADSDDTMNDVSMQSSFDGGRTFTPSIRLTDRPFDSRIGWGSERDLPDLGSRLGLISTDERALALWTDTRAGTVASNKQDLVRAVVEVAPPRGPSVEVKEKLRWAGLAAVFGGVVLIGIGIFGRRKPGTHEMTS